MAPAGIGVDVEGLHAVAAAAAAGRVRELYVEARRRHTPEVEDLVGIATSAGAKIREIEDVRTLAVTSAPQGVVARCEPKPVVGLADVVARHRPASVLVLDHVGDPHNLGAAARSAVAAGVTSLVVPTRRSAPFSAAAFKAAAGALEHMAVALVSSVAEAVKGLGRLGVWTVGLDRGGDRSLFGLDLLSEPVAVVVGAEGTGLAHLVRKRVDVVAGIPLYGPVESLNASVAAALACFEIQRVRRGADPLP